MISEVEAYNSFEFQLGMALLCVHNSNDTNHQWLAGPYSGNDRALERLHLIAQNELEAK